MLGGGIAYMYGTQICVCTWFGGFCLGTQELTDPFLETWPDCKIISMLFLLEL